MRKYFPDEILYDTNFDIFVLKQQSFLIETSKKWINVHQYFLEWYKLYENVFLKCADTGKFQVKLL